MHAQTYPQSTHDDFRRIADANPNARLTRALVDWAEAHGYIAFDSSAGFACADGSIFQPDGAIVSLANWEALTVAQREAFQPIAPEVAIELASQSDRPNGLKAKLRHFRAVGTAFVVLIDPYRKAIWTDGTPPAGFSIDLESLLS